MHFFGLKFENDTQEKEYFTVKFPMLQKFFEFLLLVLTLVAFAYLISDILRSTEVYIIITVLFFVLALALVVLKKRIEKWIEPLIVLATLAGYIYVLFRNATYFFHRFDKVGVFYAGYGFALFHQICMNRLINYFSAIILDLVLFIARTSMIGIGDHFGTFILHLMLDLVLLFVHYTREKDDRKMFKSFFDSREELVKFKLLISKYLPDSVLVVDLENKTLFLNDSYKRTFPNYDDTLSQLENFSLEQDSIEKQKDSLSLHDSNTVRNVKELLEHLNKKKLLNKEIICFRASSTPRNERKLFNVKIFPIRWDGDEALTILFNDITDQETILRLKIADSNKDRVINSVSHELRTPIHGILGILNIIEKEVRDHNVRRYIDYCKANCDLLLTVVSSILDLQQIRRRKLKLSPSYFSLAELFEQVRSLFEYGCDKKKLSFKLELEETIPAYIFTDKARLYQILVNLVGNAIKFTMEGGITMGACLNPRNNNEIIFWVSDTGIGIKQEELPKLFKMYGKLEDPDSNNTHGIGLGLTISTSLAKMMNSANEGIQVDSIYGKGTKFFFTIDLHLQENTTDIFPPLAEEGDGNYNDLIKKLTDHCLNIETHVRQTSIESAISRQMTDMEEYPLIIPRTSEREPTGHCPVPQRRESILIVDDNSFNLMVAEATLQKLGYQTFTAMNGKEAIDAVEKITKDGVSLSIIFMDLQMPIMDGYDATLELKKKMKEKIIPNIPIVALSANDQEADKQKCWEVGMDDHLSKPLNHQKLHAILAKYAS